MQQYSRKRIQFGICHVNEKHKLLLTKALDLVISIIASFLLYQHLNPSGHNHST